MFSKFTKQLFCSQINLCAKFLIAQRSSSIFGKPWSSTAPRLTLRSRRTIVRFRSTGSTGPFKTVLSKLWKLGSSIVVGKPDTTIATHSAETMNLIGEIVQKVSPAVVAVENKRIWIDTRFVTLGTSGGGTGFIVRSYGLILTNAHVVQNYRKVLITLHNGKTYDGIVEHVDPKIDLATIKINESNLPVLKLADSKQAKAGDIVIALGNNLFFKKPVSFGVISNTQETFDDHPVIEGLCIIGTVTGTYIRTDVAVTFGNSGGPLVNLDGKIVGINKMIGVFIKFKTLFRIPFEISCFAIPSNYAKGFLENAEKEESHRKTFGGTKSKHLGIGMFTLDGETLKELKRKNRKFPNVNHGMLVHTVQRGTPSHKAGLRRGDIITEIDSKPICTSEEMEKLIQTSSGSLQLTIIRKNITINVNIFPAVDYD